MSWRWKEKVIEKVKKFNYVGYMFQSNGKQDEQIRNKVSREGK